MIDINLLLKFRNMGTNLLIRQKNYYYRGTAVVSSVEIFVCLFENLREERSSVK